MNSAGRGLLRRQLLVFSASHCGGSCLLFPRVIAAAVAFLQCDDPLKRTRVARFYCADFFACQKRGCVRTFCCLTQPRFVSLWDVARCNVNFFMPKKWRRRGTHRHKCRIPRKLRGRLNTFRLQRLHLLRIRRCKCRMRCSRR